MISEDPQQKGKIWKIFSQLRAAANFALDEIMNPSKGLSLKTVSPSYACQKLYLASHFDIFPKKELEQAPRTGSVSETSRQD